MVGKKTCDKDQVIEKSMRLFWKKGYQGTTLSELTEVTGLQKGSLYGTFHSKEHLFRLSLQRYGERMRKTFISDECPFDYLKTFFSELISEGVSGEAKYGCLIMNSTQEFGEKRGHKSLLAHSLFLELYQNFERTLDIALERNLLPKRFDKKACSDRLIGAAFSIRELSKFRKDEELFVNIASGVLKDLDISLN